MIIVEVQPMFYRHLLFLVLLIGNAYRIIRRVIIDRQQKKPLPEEVKDIYTPEKYQDFLNHEHDYLPLFIAARIINIALNGFYIYSPYYLWMEKLGRGNAYLIMLATVLSSELLSVIFSLPRSWYATFTIEEKYGLNRQTKKDFIKDEMLSVLTSLFASIALYSFIIFVTQKLSMHIEVREVSYAYAFGLMAIVIIISVIVIFGIAIIAYLIQRRQYSYRDLEEGELRNKIIALTQGAKKKVRRIEVYDESKKSNSKNAYLLTILWYRAFGIADNYLDENSERELLAVLSHEAGHLKHRKDLLDYSKYLLIVIVLIVFALLLPHAELIDGIVNNINQAYGLSISNYVLLMSYVSALMSPLSFFAGIAMNFVSRRNETEADLNAVKEGYGEELIQTFRQMSTDELIDVNPSPVIEFLEYDHPSIVKRIRTIREALKVQTMHA